MIGSLNVLLIVDSVSGAPSTFLKCTTFITGGEGVHTYNQIIVILFKMTF